MNGVPFLYNVQWKIEKMTTGQRKSYVSIPDTAVMIRRDRINRKFSDYEEPLLYKGK